MSVVINSFGQIARRLGIEKGGPANAYLTNLCYKKMDRYVPMSAKESAGNLRTIVDISAKSITYQSPYARYQYFGQRADGRHIVKNYTTPGTGSYWDKKMLSVEKQNIINSMNKYIKGHGVD